LSCVHVSRRLADVGQPRPARRVPQRHIIPFATTRNLNRPQTETSTRWLPAPACGRPDAAAARCSCDARPSAWPWPRSSPPTADPTSPPSPTQPRLTAWPVPAPTRPAAQHEPLPAPRLLVQRGLQHTESPRPLPQPPAADAWWPRVAAQLHHADRARPPDWTRGSKPPHRTADVNPPRLPTLPTALHPDLRQLAQPRRRLVRQTNPTTNGAVAAIAASPNSEPT
jgi:hypothetical protein